jgi:hypothetical protein
MNRRTFLSALATLPAVGVGMASSMNRAAALMQQLAVPRLDASIWIYLWDLVDEGYDQVLGRLKENGLTSVSLATAYHAGRFLLPHNPRRKVTFLEDGVVYFNPSPHLYGRIKPSTHTLVREGHGLDLLKKYADRAGMETRAWVVCCHNTPLGMRYPDIACRTAFGDRLYHNLCPSNEDVRAYLRGLAQDISVRGVTTLELEALQFQGYVHGFHHERDGIPLTDAMRFLLGLCFCDACWHRSKNGGLDLEPLQSFTTTVLGRYFANPNPSAAEFREIQDLPSDLFEPFQLWRESVVVSLVEELHEATHATGVKLRPMTSLNVGARQQTAMNPARVAGVTGGILATAYVRDGAALRQALSPLQETLGGAELILGFQVGLPESGGREEFLDRMKAARGMGITRFNYYNYGLIPLSNLAWIKEGLSS